MTMGVEIRNLSCRFGDTTALDDLSFSIPAGTLCGLLGRNGSGKSTLLETIAAFRRPTAGQVLVDGEDPYENADLMADICLVRETGDIENDNSVKDAFEIAAMMRSGWDEDYAQHLVERFELPTKGKVTTLSLGQRSTLGTVVGLASRAPLTMFDESYLGMDAISRRVFYDELLGDYLRSGRTFVVSTHLIGEIAPLLEQVVVLEHGRLGMQEDVEELRSRGVALTGPAEAVDRLAAGLTVVDERRLGATKQVTVYGQLPSGLDEQARAAGVELGAVALADLLVHLTDIDRHTQVADPDHEMTATPTTGTSEER